MKAVSTWFSGEKTVASVDALWGEYFVRPSHFAQSITKKSKTSRDVSAYTSTYDGDMAK